MPGDERIVELAASPARLGLSHGRLVIRRDHQQEVAIAMRELAITIVAHPQVSTTVAALAGLMKHGGSLIVCDDRHLPVGIMLPLDVNHEQTRRTRAQIESSRPTAKRLWAQIVRAKIRAQARVLECRTGRDAGLREIAKRVRSGDPANVEATAAQRYWPRVFDDPMFRRRRDAPDQNCLLNYGYAVLRAAVGRAVCAAGLHPSLGIHHHGRTNPWVLADDLMEPFRPLIDHEVAEVVAELGADTGLTPPVKHRLIGVLHERMVSNGESRTVLDWIGRSASSLARVYLGERRLIAFPEGLWHDHSTA